MKEEDYCFYKFIGHCPSCENYLLRKGEECFNYSKPQISDRVRESDSSSIESKFNL